MVDINPYQILGLSPDASLDAVKESYRQLATKHHPDKGGNPETFKIVKLAFKMIADSIKKGVPIQRQNSSTYADMKESAQNFQTSVKMPTPQEFLGTNNPNQKFDMNLFNRKFTQETTEDNNCLISKAEADYRENRTKEQLLSEQKSIESELANIRPIFNAKEFNNNAFQRLYEHVNGGPDTKDVQVYEEPISLTSGLQPYTEIDDQFKVKQTDHLGFCSLTEGFGHKVPSQFDSDIVKQMASKPDITNVSTLEPDYHKKIKNKLNDYNSININCHPAPANPQQLPDGVRNKDPLPEKITQQGMSDAYNRKLQERNGLVNEIKYGNQMPPPQQMIPQMQQPQQQPQLQQSRQQFAPRQFSVPVPCHNSLPVLEYPRSSNIDQQAPNGARQDFFMKIPTATQQTPMYQQHPQMPMYQQHPQHQQHQQHPQHPQQHQQQMPVYHHQPQTPMYQPQQQMPVYQQPQQIPNYTQNTAIEQMQQQMQNLQKTLLQQKKVIRKLKTKK